MTDDTKPAALMSIGELARNSGLPVRTIRFYCDEGILESQRSGGGHRMFDADSATERLLLVRRLRALGLGLDSITGVLREEQSMEEAIAAESAKLDIEFRSLAWRRASVRAMEAAAPEQRADRLALLAVAQDGNALHECLIRFWHRILTPIPRSDSDGWVCWNVPEPPTDPSVDEVVTYAELAALASSPDLNKAVRHQYWRDRPDLIRDPRALYHEMGELMIDVVPLVADGIPPHPGNELDRFVTAHATARGERDTRQFREHLLRDATDSDPRIHRYWSLTDRLLGPRVTIGRAHDWLYNALEQASAARAG
ncbi:MerR family transcriptional regulator [Nocardia sp. NPDC005825]|uniref:MerR family transcriptional regulator n=1 Tax=unclassified Nocardia TaxID=2637762 RepID=UPI0033C3BD49